MCLIGFFLKKYINGLFLNVSFNFEKFNRNLFVLNSIKFSFIDAFSPFKNESVSKISHGQILETSFSFLRVWDVAF